MQFDTQHLVLRPTETSSSSFSSSGEAPTQLEPIPLNQHDRGVSTDNTITGLKLKQEDVDGFLNALMSSDGKTCGSNGSTFLPSISKINRNVFDEVDLFRIDQHLPLESYSADTTVAMYGEDPMDDWFVGGNTSGTSHNLTSTPTYPVITKPVASSCSASTTKSKSGDRKRKRVSTSSHQEDELDLPCPTKSRRRNSSMNFASSQNQSNKWRQRYEELQEFQREYGHCSVPSHWPTNPSLAQWVKRQRYQYKLRKRDGWDNAMSSTSSTMSDDRKALLDKLGFVWDSHSEFWDDRFKELQAFREQHGHCNVPTKYPKNQQLAIWAKCQRRQYKLFKEGAPRTSMTVDRTNKLQDLGFIFDPRGFKKRRQQLFKEKIQAAAKSSSTP